MWALVFIDLVLGTTSRFDVYTEVIGVYPNFQECFYTRDARVLRQGNIDGYPSHNTQFVCVRIEDFTDKD